MSRTKRRPLPTGKIKSSQAIIMATLLIIVSMFLLVRYVNTLTAVLTFFTMVGYAFIYTLYLKRATPQNIVIGGLAGAMPPLLGWTAVTGHVDPAGLLLVLIIFMWTPPHFWALAIARVEEYAKVDIPMLPVTHGLEYTRINVLVYTVLMAAVTYLPIMINMSGLIYGVGVTILNALFLYYAIKMYRTKSDKDAMKTFGYSIVYLMLLFIVMLADHYALIFF